MADAYDRHVGRYGQQLAAGLIEATGVRPGQRASMSAVDRAS